MGRHDPRAAFPMGRGRRVVCQASLRSALKDRLDTLHGRRDGLRRHDVLSVESQRPQIVAVRIRRTKGRGPQRTPVRTNRQHCRISGQRRQPETNITAVLRTLGQLLATRGQDRDRVG